MYTYVFIRIYIDMCNICIDARMCVCMFIYIHMYIHICMYIYTV